MGQGRGSCAGNEGFAAFRPGPLWRSAHLQTIFRGVLCPVVKVAWHRYRLATEHGDSLSLDTLASRGSPRARLLVLHGITGSSSASPIPNLAARLAVLGVETHVLHLRGADRVCPTIPRLYHAGCSDDLQAIFRQLPQDLPWRFIGFSLGANLLLKWLAENEEIPEARALAVSCPFDLGDCARNLEASAITRLYRYVLIRRLKSLVRPFAARYPDALDSAALARCRTFFDFDNFVTAKLHGFEGAEHYWKECSALGFLSRVATATTILHAADDPFQPRPPRHIENPRLRWEIHSFGGHLGFLEGWGRDWLLERLVHHASPYGEDGERCSSRRRK